MWERVNFSSHTEAFRRLRIRRASKTDSAAYGGIVYKVYSLILSQPQCVQLYPVAIDSFTDVVYVGKGQEYRMTLITPFPHTTVLQQTTLNIFSQKIEYLYNYIDNL